MSANNMNYISKMPVLKDFGKTTNRKRRVELPVAVGS